MSGVQSFVCETCDTVLADVVVPRQCPRCGGVSIDEIGPGTQAKAYFEPPGRRDGGYPKS